MSYKATKTGIHCVCQMRRKANCKSLLTLEIPKKIIKVKQESGKRNIYFLDFNQSEQLKNPELWRCSEHKDI